MSNHAHLDDILQYICTYDHNSYIHTNMYIHYDCIYVSTYIIMHTMCVHLCVHECTHEYLWLPKSFACST